MKESNNSKKDYRRTPKEPLSKAEDFFQLNVAPRTPWEAKAAEACNRLIFLGHSEPSEMLREISEILERKVENLTEEEVSYKDIKYVCYVLAELTWETEWENDFRVGPYDKHYLYGCFYTSRGPRNFILQFTE